MFGTSAFGGVGYALPYGLSRRTVPPVPAFRADIKVEIDWNGDGTFGGGNEDITNYLRSCEYVVGRDYASQFLGRSVAGSFRALALNSDGRFSPFNSSGPLYGNLLPNRKVKVSSANSARVLWTGFLSSPPKPTVQVGSIPKASIEAVGPLAILGNPNSKVTLGPFNNYKTGQIVNAILDAAGWPASARTIATGSVELGTYFCDNKGALQALQEIEELEGGFIREGNNWDIIFEDRYTRILAALSNTSQATFSDAAGALLGYRAVSEDDPQRQIVNDVSFTVNGYLPPSAEQVVFTLTTPITVPASSSVTVICVADIGAYVIWTDPVGSIDLSSLPIAWDTGPVGISTVKRAKSLILTITNYSAIGPTIISGRIRGRPVFAADSTIVRSSDATSQNKYSARSYPYDVSLFTSAAFAQGLADYIVANLKDPHPVLTIEFSEDEGNKWIQANYRTLSDRITLTATSAQSELGISQDFYIESISQKWDANKIPTTQWMLSPAAANPGYWQLDVSQLGTTTKLGY